MANKILQIDLQNDITPQIGSYDNTGNVTPNNWRNEDGVYSLGPTNVDGTTPYYWFTPTREVTDFDLCWEDYQNSQNTSQYHLEIGDSAGNVVLSAFRSNANYYIGPVNVGTPAYQTWHKMLVEVRKASASSSTVTAYVDGKKVATGTSATLITSAKIALLGHVPDSYYWQNAGQRVRYVTIYDRSYSSKGVNLDGIMTTITGFVNKLKGALSTVAFSGSYNDLSDKPTISTVNDGTLTIQKNGTNVATFTANQSTAATANITVPTAVSELTNDSGYLTSSSNLDASKLTSGTVDIARLPQGALERLIKVANEAARYALTIADVQLGDTVQQLDTGIMYIVTDADHLDSAAGYTEYTAGTAASVPWSGVTGKPTFAAVATSGAYSDLTGTPTIPTVNDATLTIQQNGVNVQTFTANASTNATANIQCVDLSTAQTIAGDKDFTGTTGTHDVIPATTDTYDLGSSAKEYNNAYIKALTVNGTAAGDILTHNASEFVPVTGTSALAGSIVPSTDNAYDLGDSTYGFKDIYTNKLYLKGSTIFKLVDDSFICLGGATAQANGANLTLNGKSRSTSTGEFKLEARDGTYTRQLIGKPDGTLSWSNKNVAMQEDVIPRSGGAVITGSRISRTTDTSELSLDGGSGWEHGSTIALFGKDNGGNIFMAVNAGAPTQYNFMYLYPDGTWTWSGTACQTSSDQRLKQQITQIDDDLLTAWEDVELSQFKYNDAVEQKGKDKARLHTGYVVQQIDEACKKHNVDVSKYGLYCHEEYAEETREVEQADGTKKTEVVRPANEHYSLRYTEALIVECAFLRKKLKELTARIEQLEKGNNVK